MTDRETLVAACEAWVADGPFPRPQWQLLDEFARRENTSFGRIVGRVLASEVQRLREENRKLKEAR